MSGASSGLPELGGALRRVHRSVLLALALCAMGIAMAETADDPVAADLASRPFTAAAVILGLASILARRSADGPRTGLRGRVYYALAGLVLAAAIGGVGVALALLHGARETALLYTLGAAILALRPVVLR